MGGGVRECFQILTPQGAKLVVNGLALMLKQSAEFRRRRYSKISVRGEIRPKIGNFRYSSDICVVLPDLRNIRQIFVVCLTSRNIRQIFDSSSTTNEREACPQS